MSKRLERVQSLVAKIESSEGVDVSPGTGDAVRPAGSIGIQDGAEVANGRDDAISETIDRLGPLPLSAKWVELTIPVHLRGYGSAYSASNLPESDVLNRICGLSQTVVTTGGSESVTYELRSTGQESATLKWYADGMLHALLGCRGTVAFSAPAGDALMATYTVRGIYVLPTDTSLVAGTYDTTVPPLFKASSSLSFNGVTSLVVRNFEAALNGTIAPRLNANASDGLAGFHITQRDPTASFRCEAPLAATSDFRTLRDAATAVVLDVTVGATQYNRVKFHFDKFTPRTVERSYDQGFQLDTVGGRVSVEGTEDFALIFD
jgi:hypothetical protein